ncbi:unnamed protein product [Polarella glacialis]|uniref:Uncharacterized protein n=1 Tax=Polarella glacialis TaxID=89957 RepID=A0A813LHW9_POLGL|nr:unnamed protein product [Polarella glacialis]
MSLQLGPLVFPGLPARSEVPGAAGMCSDCMPEATEQFFRTLFVVLVSFHAWMHRRKMTHAEGALQLPCGDISESLSKHGADDDYGMDLACKRLVLCFPASRSRQVRGQWISTFLMPSTGPSTSSSCSDSVSPSAPRTEVRYVRRSFSRQSAS